MSIEGFKERLQSLVNKEPSVNAFAIKCKCTEGALRSYLAGKSLPGLDKLVNIANAADVSVQWLATGEGQAPEIKPIDPQIREVISIMEGMRDKGKAEVVKATKKEKQIEDYNEFISGIKRLEPASLNKGGWICINLIYVLALPAMALLAFVGMQFLSGSMARHLFSNSIYFYAPVILSLWFFRVQWYFFLKHKYVSFVDMTSQRIDKR